LLIGCWVELLLGWLAGFVGWFTAKLAGCFIGNMQSVTESVVSGFAGCCIRGPVGLQANQYVRKFGS
jgi:hypothetical protein